MATHPKADYAKLTGDTLARMKALEARARKHGEIVMAAIQEQQVKNAHPEQGEQSPSDPALEPAPAAENPTTLPVLDEFSELLDDLRQLLRLNVFAVALVSSGFSRLHELSSILDTSEGRAMREEMIAWLREQTRLETERRRAQA